METDVTSQLETSLWATCTDEIDGPDTTGWAGRFPRLERIHFRINQVSGSFQAMSLEPRITRGRGKGLRKSFEQEEDKDLFKEYVVRLNVAWWHKNEETAKLHHLEFLQNGLGRRDVETASHTYCSFNCFVSEAEIRILEGKQEVTSVTPVDKYRSCLHDFAMSDEVMRCMEGYILTPENSTPVPGLSVPLWSK